MSLYHIVYPPTKEEFCKQIVEENPGVIGFTCLTSRFPDVKKYISWAREVSPSSFIICGGYHPSLAPEETLLNTGADAVCIGEGEYPLLELCSLLEKGEDIYSIKNLWLKTENGIKKNPVRPLIEDLDTLPVPDFDIYDYSRLASSLTNTALVMVSRGCPYACSYCCNHRFKDIYPNKNKYPRFRSPQGAITILKTLLEKYPYIEYINFMDNILGLNKDWLREFTELYREQINLPFSCRLRSNLVDEEVASLLVKAGSYQVHMGVESGHPVIRREILNRKTPLDQVKRSFQILQKKGIATLSYNMVGLPYENLSRILETIRLNSELKPSRMSVAVFFPYPETELYRIASGAGFIPADKDYYSGNMPLKQPQLTEKQVIFAERYFIIFVRLFNLARRMPLPLKSFFEKIIEKVFCSRFTPRGILNVIIKVKGFLVYQTKKNLRKYLPSLYLRLRNFSGRYRLN